MYFTNYAVYKLTYCENNTQCNSVLYKDREEKR